MVTELKELRGQRVTQFWEDPVVCAFDISSRCTNSHARMTFSAVGDGLGLIFSRNGVWMSQAVHREVFDSTLTFAQLSERKLFKAMDASKELGTTPEVLLELVRVHAPRAVERPELRFLPERFLCRKVVDITSLVILPEDEQAFLVYDAGGLAGLMAIQTRYKGRGGFRWSMRIRDDHGQRTEKHASLIEELAARPFKVPSLYLRKIIYDNE